MTKEEWEDYKKLSGEITNKLDNTGAYESWLIIQEYVDRCQEQNQELKKQLANNGIVRTCENCEWFGICPHSYKEYDYKNEREKLKKQLEELEEHSANAINKQVARGIDLVNQQKEFIKYLEDKIEEKVYVATCVVEYNNSVLPLKEILSKYKEIIGA